jgi:SAM-dependent methyltransferase
MTKIVHRLVRILLPRRVRAALGTAARRATRWPPVGHVDLGDLRRSDPISSDWGFDRGQSIDRFFIERFLQRHTDRVRGRVLEVKHRTYTEQFGSAVTASDVIDLSASNPDATVIGDLAAAPHLPDDVYDCVILTQTLHYIFDTQAALATIARILKPGGTLLITVPGISPMSITEMADYGEFWRFTSMSMRRLLDGYFHEVHVQTFGNVLSTASFLYGLAASELEEAELLHEDARYELVVAARATRPRREAAP